MTENSKTETPIPSEKFWNENMPTSADMKKILDKIEKGEIKLDRN